MNTIVKTLFSVALLTWMHASHAELVLDTKYLGSDKELKELSSTLQVSNFFEGHEEKIEADLLARGEIAPASIPLISWGCCGHAHAIFNGKDYYLRAFNYTVAAQRLEYEKSTVEKRKHRTLPGGGACVLYVNDKDLNKVAALKISLPENNYGTWCNGVDGIGSAGKGRDGVLIPISYYLTDNTPAKRPEEIGQGWRYMTVLIRFAEVDGKLSLTQDDRCLGNPNKYKEIPSARKALSRCEGQ
ncbi:hypothetical protein C8E02_1661 [Vogesella indigofera]|uniref:Uncharacterized protein n=1 Tax=Vogesella indigofera TaxID=45465 RepID=A0A495BGU7_VOGIN|nr:MULTISPECIES: hypothetical protein [Vogesella]RKQ60317.1 hypothetical protein C8E02_1661 [Vogesella indigofera]